MNLRLDKYITENGLASRSDAGRSIRFGEVRVNGQPVRDPSFHIDPETDRVSYKGEEIIYRRFTYIMMNKPEGVLSATEDSRQTTVLDLLDKRLKRIGLFPCGRLDKDTVGLLILTNDGQLSHKLLSPRHHVPKTYRFETEKPLSRLDELEAGVTLEDGLVTKPCTVTPEGERRGTITITEGKFHQIKRMFEAVDNRITFLERIDFAGIPLDPNLPRGSWRYLTPEEESLITGENE